MAKKFEYKVLLEKHLTEGYDRERMEERFVQLGQEGWELVGTVSDTGGQARLFFKREIESPLTHKQERSGYDMSR